MNLTDRQLPQVGSEKLELALLTFFDQFKKIYIGEQINKSSKVGLLPYNSFSKCKVREENDLVEIMYFSIGSYTPPHTCFFTDPNFHP